MNTEPMSKWYDNAWVRKTRLAYDVPDTISGHVHFSPRLVPPLRHPRIVERGESFARKLLTHRFYTYAGFTAVLEREAVNEATLQIAGRRFWTALPQKMYLDAGKIYTDEGFHAQESDQILQAVIDSTGIQPDHLARPQFITRLKNLLATLNPQRQQLVLLGFSIVSETLISSILADVPSDPVVEPCVRGFVRAHAQDEGLHHAYFSNLLKVGWPMLCMADREFLGQLIPVFIHWFLDPDLEWFRSFLRQEGFGMTEIEEIVCESYPLSAVEEEVRKTAQHSVARFVSVGAFEDRCTVDAFAAAGLLKIAA